MKSFVIVLLGRLLQMILAFVALRAMSSLLGAKEMGRLSMINAVVAFFALVMVNPTGMYINRRLHAWAESGVLLKRLMEFSFFLIGVSLLAALTIPLVQLAFGHPWPIDNVWLVSLVAGYLLMTTMNQTIIPSLNILGHRLTWLLFSTFTLAAALGLSLFLAQRSATAEFWQVGQLAGYLIGFAIALPVFIKFVRREKRTEMLEPDTLKTVAAFTLPLALAVSLNWVQFQSYRLVVSHWIGLEALGKFAGVYMLVAGLMAAFESLIQQYFYPQLYAQSSSPDAAARARAWKQFASAALPTTLIGGLTLLAAGRPLIHAMLAPAFQDAHEIILVAVLAETARVCANIYGMAGQVAMKTRSLLMPQVVSALVLVILIPVCFGAFSTQSDFAFLLALGLPALLLVGLSALYARRELSVSIGWASFGPALIALALSAVIYILNLGFDYESYLFTAAELGAIGIVFSSLMVWTVLRWRASWAPSEGTHA